MMEQKISKETLNWARVVFSIFYLLLALLLIGLFRKHMFYFEVEADSWNIYRFTWCLSAVFTGFSCVAFSLRHHEPSPFPAYITHYPVQLIAMATLVFGGLHIFDATSGYLFYYLSFGLCFTLGYLVDSYWAFIKSVVDARANKQ